MYERFFGLRERPFDLLPNPRFLYLTGRHREAFSNLRYGLTVPRGVTLLIGGAGTGKTTLLQSVLAELDPDNVECVLLSNPTLTRAEFYEFLATSFGLGSGAAASKTRFLFDLRQHLQARHAAGRLSALVLDEAQSLPYELLEEVRLLSNIETPTVKLLNVVLAGQPELAARLNEPGLRQLKQRVSLRCEIEPLNFPDTAAYVAGRLRIAGGDPAAIFSREAILAIHEVSGGVPRVINVVCDNALIGGFAAEMKPVLRALVDDVCRDFDLNPLANERLATALSPAAKEPPAEKGASSRQMIDADTVNGQLVAALSPAARESPAEKRASEDTGPMVGTFDRKKRFSFF
jgi:general secretion pathway protein A